MTWLRPLVWSFSGQDNDKEDHIVPNGSSNDHAQQGDYVNFPAADNSTLLANCFGKPYSPAKDNAGTVEDQWDIIPRPYRVLRVVGHMQLEWRAVTASTSFTNSRLQLVLQKLELGSTLSNVFLRRETAPGTRDQDVTQMREGPIMAPRGSFSATEQSHVQNLRVDLRVSRRGSVGVVDADHMVDLGLWRSGTGGSLVVGRTRLFAEVVKLRPNW